MKNHGLALFLCTLFLATSFLGAGYASLNDELTVSGEGVAKAPEPALYITSVAVVSQRGASSEGCSYILPTNLQTEVAVSSVGATVTYEITVYNDTDITYWYLGPTAYDKFGQNSLVGATNGVSLVSKDNENASSTVFDEKDWVPPQTSRTFYVTYTFGRVAQGSVSLLVNFNFGLHMDAVQDEVLNVLNDKISPNGYTYLSQVFDEVYAETGATVIGNMGEHQEVFDRIFGADLTVNVNGEERPVTIMIERKDVDGNASSGDNYSGSGAPVGCEYTIYITTDELSSPGGKATVYAVSYTCGSDDVWYQIGELYEGKSTVEDYDATDGEYDGAFDVDSWKAVEKTYVVTDKISYKVGCEQGTQYDKLSTLEEIMSAKDQEFYNKVNNNSGDLLKPVCQIVYSYRHNNGQYEESQNLANSGKEGYAVLKTVFDKIKPYCLIANGAQEVKVQNANSLTRAELIRMLEEIQHAYDYYKSVNPNG